MNNKYVQVDCVVVTYNRLNLLKKCVDSLLNQSYKLKNIFIVNNNSNDDTKIYLDKLSKKYKNIKPINLTKNVGGAGGFNKGMKSFINYSQSDYVWIMDDDTIPTYSALEKMISKLALIKNLGFLASNVKWKNGEAAVMNVPGVPPVWSNLAEYNLIKIKYASFVSLLFPRNVIKEIGYPIKDFFIWGDDYEYTTRIYRKGYDCYFVNDSIVEHKIKYNIGANIYLERNPKRVPRYYFDARNRVFFVRRYENKRAVLNLILRQGFFRPIKLMLSSNSFKMQKAWYSFKGTISGIFFNPTIEKVEK